MAHFHNLLSGNITRLLGYVQQPDIAELPTLSLALLEMSVIGGGFRFLVFRAAEQVCS